LQAKTVQGGQYVKPRQLAKKLFLTRGALYTRKAKEAVMAVVIDARYPKDEEL